MSLETKEALDPSRGTARGSAGPAESFFAIGLEPPGNVAREAATFKRRLFSILGDPSALAFPDSAILAFGARPPSPSPLQAQDRRRVSRALARAWESVDPESAFGIGAADEGGGPGEALLVAGSALFLRFRGPVERLADDARSFFGTIGLSGLADPPFEAGRGCFLCAEATPAALAAAEEASPPAAAFRDCALVLWSFAIAREGLRASSWRELARAARPSVKARGFPPLSDRGLRT